MRIEFERGRCKLAATNKQMRITDLGREGRGVAILAKTFRSLSELAQKLKQLGENTSSGNNPGFATEIGYY